MSASEPQVVCLHSGNFPQTSAGGIVLPPLCEIEARQNKARALLCCLPPLPPLPPPISPLSCLLSAAQTRLSRVTPVLATYVTLYLGVISCPSSLPPSLPPLSVPVCVCLRLADRHTGPAVGGSGPHPALLPRGGDLPVPQLQEPLLQARGCHAVFCRYVKRNSRTKG